ncbi:MAG: hypothetical protein EZS28_022456 [Streblomastix strix]|uniref:Uncharacterized protein n=1 Tax=Streblomastix strix TaxID=222440 RepID=A0A5J4VI06_9EUKA|nr:MAG: hypothetical protein EZS28_022456 [Streblomastix strix]
MQAENKYLVTFICEAKEHIENEGFEEAIDSHLFHEIELSVKEHVDQVKSQINPAYIHPTNIKKVTIRRRRRMH